MLCGELPSQSGIADVNSASRRDEKLVAAVRAGSGAAFGKLQKLYSDRLYRRIFSITRSREDTEDVLQETFLRAFTRIDSFEGRSQFSTWLTRIAINTALMFLRKQRTRGEMSLHAQPESGDEICSFDICDSALNPEEICDLKQRFNVMYGAIERLDPKLRTAVRVWISKERSMKEIACSLDVSIASVKARIHRARKKLALYSGIGQHARRAPSPHCRTHTLESRVEKSHARIAIEHRLPHCG
jgi:RNA polymerase sigma-70 factor (ECF subfamily)